MSRYGQSNRRRERSTLPTALPINAYRDIIAVELTGEAAEGSNQKGEGLKVERRGTPLTSAVCRTAGDLCGCVQEQIPWNGRDAGDRVALLAVHRLASEFHRRDFFELAQLARIAGFHRAAGWMGWSRDASTVVLHMGSGRYRAAGVQAAHLSGHLRDQHPDSDQHGQQKGCCQPDGAMGCCSDLVHMHPNYSYCNSIDSRRGPVNAKQQHRFTIPNASLS